ncbi:MAG: S41 family peptidase [Planctomycetota bacterium]|jgi:hypothetical protein
MRPDSPRPSVARWALLLGAAIGALAITAPVRAANVTVNGTFAAARCIVHELADDEDKAGAVAFVEGFRDHFFPDLELIDATRTDEATLRQKLAGGFILFASHHEGSRLLPAALSPLPLEHEGDSVRLRGVTVPVAEARLICVGKNPFSDGHVVVYAAGRNSGIRNINAVFHGPRSYHLFRGQQLAGEGDYSSSFEFAAERLPLSEATEDVDQLFSSLERVHPDLLARVTAPEYVDMKRWVVDEVGRRLDASGTIAVKDLAFLLYRAAAFFGDGHTSLRWTETLNDGNAAGTRFPPFVLEFRNGRFVAAASSDDRLLETEVIEIEGVPTLEFLAPILDRCSGEILAFRASRFMRKQDFWWWITGALESRDSIAVTTRAPGGETARREVATIDHGAFSALERTWQERRRAGRRSGLTYHDEGRIACFAYPSFVLSDGEKQRIDEVFREIGEAGVRDLIIDIRDNGGGNSAMGDYIFTYLTDEPFRAFSKVRVRLSRDVMAGHPEMQRYADQEGLVVTHFGTEQEHPRPEHEFTGRRVMLLVDNGTFSSATDFAVMFRDYGIGEIVGYETGGLPTSFGDVFSLSLANSRIPYGVSYKQFFGPRPRPGDDEHGVLPDVPVSDEVLAPHRAADDPVLAFAVERLVRTRKAPTRPAAR